jgi:hypothetical protein
LAQKYRPPIIVLAAVEEVLEITEVVLRMMKREHPQSRRFLFTVQGFPYRHPDKQV